MFVTLSFDLDECKDIAMRIFYFSEEDSELDLTLPKITMTFSDVIYYHPIAMNGDHQENIYCRNIDVAIKRLEKECKAILKFRSCICTNEQKWLVEFFGLAHTGKHIVIDKNLDCLGIFYDKNSIICNSYCDKRKDCAHQTEEHRKKIKELFPTMYKTIFRLIREYAGKSTF